MKPANAWESLVQKLGLEGAKEEMQRRRGLVKNHPGGAFRDKKFAKAMSAKSKKKLGSEAEG
jgi:hypothetical protein